MHLQIYVFIFMAFFVPSREELLEIDLVSDNYMPFVHAIYLCLCHRNFIHSLCSFCCVRYILMHLWHIILKRCCIHILLAIKTKQFHRACFHWFYFVAGLDYVAVVWLLLLDLHLLLLCSFVFVVSVLLLDFVWVPFSVFVCAIFIWVFEGVLRIESCCFVQCLHFEFCCFVQCLNCVSCCFVQCLYVVSCWFFSTFVFCVLLDKIQTLHKLYNVCIVCRVALCNVCILCLVALCNVCILSLVALCNVCILSLVALCNVCILCLVAVCNVCILCLVALCNCCALLICAQFRSASIGTLWQAVAYITKLCGHT